MKINGQIFHQSRHLDENKLLAAVPECPICGSSNRTAEYVLQTEPLVELLKCRHCHASSASRIPTSEALADYYANYYIANEQSDTVERVTFDNSPRFGAHLADHFGQSLNNKHLDILDFGGGDGSIAYWMATMLLERGTEQINIIVIDYNNQLIESQNARITISRQAEMDDVSERFDIVIASAIIEHLPEPAVPLTSLLQSMKEGGLFYARTPYVAPLMKLLKKLGIGWDFTFPAHIHDLGQDFWENYFTKQDLHGRFELLSSNPSIVETTFNEHWMRTLAAHTLKAPWYLFGRSYALVGGWEIFVKKTNRCK